MALPLVRIATSSSIAFRRSPIAGRLDGGDLDRPRSLLTTRVASASPSGLRDDQQRAAGLHHLLEHGQQVAHRADPLLVDQDERVLQDDFHPLGMGDEIGRRYPRSNCIPSTTSSDVSMLLLPRP